ncbi:MAG TPA: ABC transporter substrate-binding protein, partial [Microvirga sp.]|nr:ABC transporter substrate-binding protein [Microvirga sp.]
HPRRRGDRMRRREFIAVLSAGAGWSFATGAQQVSMPVIGLLNGQSSEGWSHLLAAFRQGLNEAGYVEGRTVRIEYRFADNQVERLPELARELARLPVNVLVTSGGEVAARAAVAATSSIPIVATFGGDPVLNNLVVSLNRPGNNLTGVSLFNVTLVAKQLGVLHELLPEAKSVGVLANPSNPNAKPMLKEAETAAKALGLRLSVLKAAHFDEIEGALAAIAGASPPTPLIVVGDPHFTAQRGKLVVLATRLGIMYFLRGFAEAGGLIAYGSNREADYHLLGVYTARILQGAKPSDLPIAQPTNFELVINLKTARALGLTVPPTLLARADEVIE